MTTVIPAAITSWLKRTYPKPRVDQVWLGECYQWLVEQLQISPHETKRVTDTVEEALLDSDLKDSMQPGTGFPEGVTTASDLTVQGSPILVQILDITEIGHSAFSLTNVRQTRLDQEDLAGLARENEEENENQNQDEEDAGPIPKYPRSMLKLQLSDGTITMPAIEFKRIPGLELGVTSLGCKMLLRDFKVYGGTIFLDPKCVTVKGGRVEEKALLQDELFLTGLRTRMGLPVEDSVELAAYRAENLKPPPPGNGRPPPGPRPGPSNPANNSNAPRKRKAPTKNPPPAVDSTVEKSRFFIKPKPEVTASQLIKAGVFSPLTRTGTVIEIESDEEKKQSSSPVVATQVRTLNTSLTRTETEYSFEGDDFLDSPEFFRELERVESAALSQHRAPAGSISASQARPTQNRTHQSQVSHPDTIEFDTDKENESVPVRRVKRKIVGRKVAAAPNQSVISIEDSD